MAVSKNRQNHKEKLENRKQKQKTMENQQTQPEVIQTPVWKAGDKIEMNGAEFEAIFNFLTSVSQAYSASQSVLNKNVLNGTIKIQFSKDGKVLEGEEAKPFQDELDKAIATVKSQQEQLEKAPPRLDAIVNEHGVPINEEDRGDSPLIV